MTLQQAYGTQVPSRSVREMVRLRLAMRDGTVKPWLAWEGRPRRSYETPRRKAA